MAQPRLNVRWTQNVKDTEKKQELEKTLLASKTALGRLYSILETELEELSQPRESDYDYASWAYLQAHRNGRIQQIRKTLDLLSPWSNHKS